jgi:hypothetical protein
MDVTENGLDISGKSCCSRLAVFLRPIDSGFLPLDRTIARRWKLGWLMGGSRLVVMQSKFLLLLGIELAGVIAGDFVESLVEGANQPGSGSCGRPVA